jgi:hypothetical protein
MAYAGAEGGVEPLDVGGIDPAAALAALDQALHRRPPALHNPLAHRHPPAARRTA